jgi:hypothetical protein
MNKHLGIEYLQKVGEQKQGHGLWSKERVVNWRHGNGL